MQIRIFIILLLLGSISYPKMFSQTNIRTDGVYIYHNESNNYFSTYRFLDDGLVLSGWVEGDSITISNVADYSNLSNCTQLNYSIENGKVRIIKNQKYISSALIISQDELALVMNNSEKRTYIFSPSQFNKSKKYVDTKIYKVTDRMPAFKVCQNISNETFYDMCIELEMYRFIHSNIDESYIDKSVEGIHVLKFVVEKDGSISNLSHSKSLSEDHNFELDEVISKMSIQKVFNPGTQNNKPKRVSYSLPIKFKNYEYDRIIDKVVFEPFKNDIEYFNFLETAIYLDIYEQNYSDIINLDESCWHKYNYNNYIWDTGSQREIIMSETCN